jgi:cysteine desulfuration protein SufE
MPPLSNSPPETPLKPFEDLAETFDLLGDWEERYTYLIELGRSLAPLSEAEHAEANKVRGCMSQVWLVCDGAEGGRLQFRGDSDAHIVKGLIAVLFALFNGNSPHEVMQIDVNAAFSRLGLESHISMNRRNGFYAMVERIRQTAAALQANRAGV